MKTYFHCENGEKLIARREFLVQGNRLAFAISEFLSFIAAGCVVQLASRQITFISSIIEIGFFLVFLVIWKLARELGRSHESGKPRLYKFENFPAGILPVKLCFPNGLSQPFVSKEQNVITQ